MSEFHPSEAARRAFGLTLRDLRLDAGLTATQLSAASGFHISKISRAEHGKQTISEDDVRIWAAACGQPSRADDLISTQRQVEQMWSDHRRTLKAGQEHVQARGLAQYTSAKLARVYESVHIPGILQTFGYAVAQREATARLHQLPLDDVEAAARNRLKSQVLITDGGGPTFSFLIEATALYNVLGGAEVMAEQLDFLKEVTSRPHVALGIIPLGGHRTQPAGEGFYMFDDTLVRQDFWIGGLRATRPADIAFFSDLFASLRRHALYGTSARVQIDAARRFVQNAAKP